VTTTRRLAALVVAAGQLAVPAAARAVDVGLADQKPASYADPRARALRVRYARLTVPYDAATSVPGQVQAWLDAVRAAGMAPHVAFEHLRSDACPASPCTLPSRARYAAAVRAFVARFPEVRTYTTWNEANHQTQPTAAHPEAVAAFYEDLRAACVSCTVVAGDVLDSGTYTRWLEGFLAASASGPRLWGLHDYGDVTYGRTNGVRNVLATVPGTLWIEETGGLVSMRNAAGRQTLAIPERDAALAIDRAFALAAEPRIGRMYIYHWRAGALDRFDSALVRADGTLRPSYDALARNLAARGAPARWTARWSRAHPAQLNVTVRCLGADRVCSGRVSASLRLGSSARALAKRGYLTSTGRPALTLRITVPRALRRRARAAARRSLVLRVRSLRPAAPLRSVTLALGRPR
jgi:hypothetical protein